MFKVPGEKWSFDTGLLNADRLPYSSLPILPHLVYAAVLPAFHIQNPYIP